MRHPTHKALFERLKGRDERDQELLDAAFDAQAAELPDPCDCGGEWELTQEDYNCDGDRLLIYKCSVCSGAEIVVVATRYSTPASAMGGRP